VLFKLALPFNKVIFLHFKPAV